MKKQFHILFLFLMIVTAINAQHLPRQVISTAGSDVISGSVMLSFTVGQAGPVDSGTPASFYITQGYQQGDELWVSIKNNPVVYNAISVYPNPSNGIFNLKGTLPSAGEYEYSVYDMNGSLIISGSSATAQDANVDQFLDLGQYATGYYTLIIYGGLDADKYTCVTKLSLLK